jgi:hypothetical protein
VLGSEKGASGRNRAISAAAGGQGEEEETDAFDRTKRAGRTTLKIHSRSVFEFIKQVLASRASVEEAVMQYLKDNPDILENMSRQGSWLLPYSRYPTCREPKWRCRAAMPVDLVRPRRRDPQRDGDFLSRHDANPSLTVLAAVAPEGVRCRSSLFVSAGTEGSQTRHWREPDSKHRSRSRKVRISGPEAAKSNLRIKTCELCRLP